MLQRRSFLLAVSAFGLSGALPGCAWTRNLCGLQPPPAPCVLSADASKEDVVAHLNDNTRKIRSWRTDRAKIRTRGVPVPLDATIAVESPRNFRLIVSAPMGPHEADLGSNQEHFWFWNKQNQEKHVFQARHDEPAKLKRFPIPFQPDWIIEALGVIDIDPEEVTMEPGPPKTIYLMAERVSPQGFKIRKITVVDTCRGVVTQHLLRDLHGQTIARAILSGYVRDERSQADLPTKIDLDWPQAQLEMHMTMSDIEVNPTRFPPGLWAVPHITGYSVYDLTH
ncbi:MAG: hypothetical protein ACM3U2_14735 [Deltaproteobacteria bacterium]